MRGASRAACVLIALLAGACAPREIRPSLPEAEFELAGRLAASFGGESFIGNLAWHHARSGDEMLITSPLGQGVARILRQGETVTLSTAEPREYRAADAELLTQQVLGFRLPLAGLADWVRARPATDTQALAEYSPDGRLLKLAQRGWTIEYLEYSGARPTRLRLIYPGIELRLAISQWN